MATPGATPQGDLRERYEREGYLTVQNVLDEALVEEARAHVAWLLERHPDTRPEQLHHTLMTDDPFWVRLVADDRLLDLAEPFIGPDIALFASHYIAKRPHDGQAVLWHQDGSFWPLEPMKVVTLWLALDETGPENGCLRVIPGSHRLELRPARERRDVDNVLGADMEAGDLDGHAAVDIRLAPGGVEIHHPNLVHGSHANTSPRWRRGLTIRYIPTGTRITEAQPFPSAFLLRGAPVPGVNLYQPWPAYVEGRHMPFRDSGAWNARAERWNARHREVLAQSASGEAAP